MTTVQMSPVVKLTLPILQEVNVFSRLQLRKERINEIPCFSDPVMTTWVCNPTKNPVDSGKDPDKDFCAINWICKVFFGARLGVGLKKEEPYNFEKSKEFCKALSYEELLKAIETTQTAAAVSPQESIVASQVEAAKMDEQILEKKALTAPTPSPVKSSGPPPVAKATTPKVAPTAIHGYNPGTLGHFLLVNLPENTEVKKEDLWKKTQEKGFNSEGRFNTQLSKFTTDGIVKVEGSTLTRTK
jgi:hypothetical protein